VSIYAGVKMAEVSIGKADLKPGGHRCIAVSGASLAVANVKGKYYCIDSVCTHAGGPLCEGEVGGKDGFSVTCPWHGSVFDYRSGKVLAGLAIDLVKSRRVKEKNGELFIEM
jgi:nitrite reductase/ring-hydroxylating ferredoxin subunit